MWTMGAKVTIPKSVQVEREKGEFANVSPQLVLGTAVGDQTDALTHKPSLPIGRNWNQESKPGLLI